MTVRVVPLPAEHGGLKFDLILDSGHIVTIELHEYELRAYRASISDVIEQKVLDYLREFDYDAESVHIIYC